MNNKIIELSNIFSIFHDGTITEFSIENKKLILTIEILYLAELINPNFYKFYLSLIDFEVKDFLFWLKNGSNKNSKNLNEIFKSDLEISSSEVENGNIIIYLNQLDDSVEYSGGTLTIFANDYIINTQDKKEIDIFKLGKVSKKYWDEIFPNN